jgi:hypothetical protein
MEGKMNENVDMYRVFKDGDSWCAVWAPTFNCLADSDAGFGDTPLEALEDLVKTEARGGWCNE